MAQTHFPNTFNEAPRYVDPIYDHIDAGHAEPFDILARKGFTVVEGLSRVNVAAIAEIAGQAAVLEYCPNDMGRWGDEQKATEQLKKGTGRGVFRLIENATSATAGFGWTGNAHPDEQLLTGGDNTFAIRLHESFAGHGLAVPFTQAIVYGSMKFYAAKRIGLETWASNNAAVKTYIRAGAELTAAVNDIRPTNDADFPFTKPGVDKYEGRLVRPDTRLYMKFPQTF